MTGLLYIIGSGRSGSTVIERVLNSADPVIAVGEIHALWRLPVESLLCSCGSHVPDCPFWSAVFEHANIGPAELARLAVLENQVVRNRFLATLRYDVARIAAEPRIAEFNDLQARLFAGIRASGDGALVLDSSKAGPRAWVLAAGLNPVFLHAYRGAEDVIASWRRPKYEPSTNALMKKPAISEAAMDWIKAEQAARSLARGGQTVRRVRYSDFSQAPRETLHGALDPVFPDLVDLVDWTDSDAVRPAQHYHSVLGNPDRFDRADIVIRPQRADRSAFSRGERFAIWSVGRTLETVYR